MKVHRAATDAEYAEALRQRLSLCEFVSRLDEGEHNESAVLAHGLWDIEDSCRTLVDQILPALHAPSLTDDELRDLLVDIGEEFRHILYHLRESRFYEYLRSEEDHSA